MSSAAVVSGALWVKASPWSTYKKNDCLHGHDVYMTMSLMVSNFALFFPTWCLRWDPGLNYVSF